MTTCRNCLLCGAPPPRLFMCCALAEAGGIALMMSLYKQIVKHLLYVYLHFAYGKGKVTSGLTEPSKEERYKRWNIHEAQSPQQSPSQPVTLWRESIHSFLGKSWNTPEAPGGPVKQLAPPIRNEDVFWQITFTYRPAWCRGAEMKWNKKQIKRIKELNK